MFYASAANTLKGPLVNQADIFPDLANPSFQEHANDAIHRFIILTPTGLADEATWLKAEHASWYWLGTLFDLARHERTPGLL